MAAAFYTSGTTATTATWSSWCASDTGTSATSAGIVWGIWASASTSGSVTLSSSRYVAPPETEEVRLAREARQREQELLRQEKLRIQAEAKQKSEALLVSLLDAQQRKELEEQNAFMVLSQLNKRYRIRRGRSMNVDELDTEGKKIATLCAHPSEAVPDADTMVAQMLMLTHNEQAFLKVANRRAFAN